MRPPVCVSAPVSMSSTFQSGRRPPRDSTLPGTEVDREVADQRAAVGEVALDLFALVAERDHELVVPERRVVAHDVPQDRESADFHHRLGPDGRLFGEARSEAAREDHDLHVVSLPARHTSAAPPTPRVSTRAYSSLCVVVDPAEYDRSPSLSGTFTGLRCSLPAIGDHVPSPFGKSPLPERATGVTQDHRTIPRVFDPSGAERCPQHRARVRGPCFAGPHSLSSVIRDPRRESRDFGHSAPPGRLHYGAGRTDC